MFCSATVCSDTLTVVCRAGACNMRHEKCILIARDYQWDLNIFTFSCTIKKKKGKIKGRMLKNKTDRRFKRMGGVNLCRTSWPTLHAEFGKKESTESDITIPNTHTNKHPVYIQTRTHAQSCVATRNANACVWVCVWVGWRVSMKGVSSVRSQRAFMYKACVDMV